MADLQIDRKWDWVGLVVRSRCEMANSMVKFPTGSLFYVTYQHGGATLQSKPCECCGVSGTITKVLVSDLEPVRRVEGPLEYRTLPKKSATDIENWSEDNDE